METLIKKEICIFEEKPLEVEILVEKDANGEIIDWSFLINGTEEMSKSLVPEYEMAFCYALFQASYHLGVTGHHKDLKWLIVGGADHQLSKFYASKAFSLYSISQYVMVDPLAGKLKELFSIVDDLLPGHFFPREIQLKFSDFYSGPGEEYKNFFDVAIVDVSDPEVRDFNAPAEVYKTSFFDDLLTLLKPKTSFVIMYEGENHSLVPHNFKFSQPGDINLPPSYSLIRKWNGGYGNISLWKTKK